MNRFGEQWTEEDINILLKFYPKNGSEYCANILQRSRKSIVKRANLLKIKFGGVAFKYLKENIEPIVMESKTIKEVLDKMNLRSAGGNYRVIKDYIEKYNIDISHFETNKDRMAKLLCHFQVIPLSDILIEKSSYSRCNLKNRLYKTGIKIRNCEKCGQGEEWHGEHMSLILDHINGIHDDNRIGNLRIVCPNCAATLSTHAGKNTKKAINNRIKNLTKTDGRFGPKFHNRKVKDRPDKETLLKLIWLKPMWLLCKDYNVCDRAIKKWCISYKINNPPRGYWTKLHAGLIDECNEIKNKLTKEDSQISVC